MKAYYATFVASPISADSCHCRNDQLAKVSSQEHADPAGGEPDHYCCYCYSDVIAFVALHLSPGFRVQYQHLYRVLDR